jgi:hypothetical protein
VLEHEQHHGEEQAEQGQPAGSRVQEALALYALTRIEYRDCVAARREVGSRRQVRDSEYREVIIAFVKVGALVNLMFIGRT